MRDWRLVLASASESRLRLLRNSGCQPEVVVSYVDERAIEDAWHEPDPEELAVHLAQAKADDVAERLIGEGVDRPTLVLGGDSVLNVDGEPQGKPGTPERALTRAKAMRGRSAELITGHHLIRLDGQGAMARPSSGASSRMGPFSDRDALPSVSLAVGTAVRFGSPSDDELEAYVATGEPLYVAGGFTLDGLSGPFIDGITGDPSNVIGLSLPGLRQMLAAWSIDWIV